MRDEDFELFIQEFGEATQRTAVPETSFLRWRGKLPDQLLMYWRDEGWCSYANGLFWTVNPDDYEHLVGEWLQGTFLEQIDEFQVIARSAFGELFLWGQRTGGSVTILCATHSIVCLRANLERRMGDSDFYLRTFFSNKSIDRCDLDDESGLHLFERALARLGPLASDEVYGFEPAIVIGGKMRLENLAKLKLDIHLTILRQLAAPTIPFSDVDIDKLLSP